MKNLSLVAAIAFVAILTACGSGKVNEFNHDIKNIQITKEGVDQGPNTIQAELTLPLDSVFKANKADRNKIKHITIEEFKFTMPDGMNFDNFESFTVNFYSEKNDMTKLGVINPIPDGQTSISATVTDKVNLSKYFSEPNIMLVIDANCTRADSTIYKMTADLKVKFSARETK